MAKYYPHPNCETIIEPFAGAAAYSLYGDNWKKRVILIEKDKRVADIWRYLIEGATIQRHQILKQHGLLICRIKGSLDLDITLAQIN